MSIYFSIADGLTLAFSPGVLLAVVLGALAVVLVVAWKMWRKEITFEYRDLS